MPPLRSLPFASSRFHQLNFHLLILRYHTSTFICYFRGVRRSKGTFYIVLISFFLSMFQSTRTNGLRSCIASVITLQGLLLFVVHLDLFARSLRISFNRFAH